MLRKLTGWTATLTLLTLVAACSPHKPTQNTSPTIETPTQNSANNSPETTALNPSVPPLGKTTHKIGEVVSVNDQNLDVQLTVNGIREHKGKGVIKPNRGNKWLVVSTTIANKGKEPKTFSVVSFKLLDNQNKPYEVDLLAASLEDVKSPTGQIKPGDQRRGEVAFEVPEPAKGLKLLFQPNSSACEASASKPKASETLNCQPVVVKLD